MFQGRFDGQCILYASFSGENRLMTGSDAAICDYPFYVGVSGLGIYGFFMGAYNLNSFIKSKREPNRG